MDFVLFAILAPKRRTIGLHPALWEEYIVQFDRSLALFKQARQYIPGGTQTTSKRPQAFAYGAYPIYARRASGCRIEDIDGNVYIDLVSALGPIALGYDYPAVREAIENQLACGILSGLLFPVEVEAAELLVELVPAAEQVRFFKGGGEATAAAARIARAYTQREIILNCGYRGWPDIWAAAHHEPGTPASLAGSIVSFPFNDLQALKQLLETHAGQVAAIFLDVLRTEPAPDYLAQAAQLAREHGALLVIDEIVTGFRLARGGMHEYYHLDCDMACFAKGLANGMPLSAVVGRTDIMQTAEDLRISLTYGGEALSLAAAAASMRVFQTEDVIGHLWHRGEQLMTGLTEAARLHGVPFSCYGLPPMSLMQFEQLDPDQNQDAWSFFLQRMAARGVLLRRGGVNFVSYSHTSADIDQVVEAAAAVFTELAPILGDPALKQAAALPEVDTGFRSLTGPAEKGAGER